MTALPNNTCYVPVTSFGVELPRCVVIVDIIKFTIKEADKYSRYAVLVDGDYNKLNVAMANASNNWKHVGYAKSDAERHAKNFNDAAEDFMTLKNRIESTKGDRQLKLIRNYNQKIEYFLNWGIDCGKFLNIDYATGIITLSKTNPKK